MVIAFVNQKGGVGKSTLAVNIAAEFVVRGAKVLLIDADPQQSIARWSANRHERGGAFLFPVLSHIRQDVGRQIEHLKSDYDYVLVDTQGAIRDSDGAVIRGVREIMIASDAIIVPLKPGGADAFATYDTLDLIEAAQRAKASIGQELFACLLLNQTESTVLLREARADAESAGVPLLRAEISNRIVINEAFTLGQVVRERARGRRPAQAITVGDLQGVLAQEEGKSATAQRGREFVARWLNGFDAREAVADCLARVSEASRAELAIEADLLATSIRRSRGQRAKQMAQWLPLLEAVGRKPVGGAGDSAAKQFAAVVDELLKLTKTKEA